MFSTINTLIISLIKLGMKNGVLAIMYCKMVIFFTAFSWIFQSGVQESTYLVFEVTENERLNLKLGESLHRDYVNYISFTSAHVANYL